MQLIGLLGGMSWESTQVYYRVLNELVRERRGALHSAHCLLHSVNFADIAAMQREGRWAEAGATLAEAAAGLERAGAACVVLCTNTMHKVAPAIEARLSVPLLHIADPTAAAIGAAGLHTVGLLGTRFTMEEDFYIGRMRERHGLALLTPDSDERALVNQVIYDELCQGVITPASKQRFLEIIARLRAAGAEGIILGCTEIGMLIQQSDCAAPLFDTTLLHVAAAVDFALDGDDEAA